MHYIFVLSSDTDKGEGNGMNLDKRRYPLQIFSTPLRAIAVFKRR
jgi:hypothetical protein